MDTSMYSLRILRKGKIEDLRSGFRRTDNLPFSVFVRSKKTTMEANIVIQCRLIKDSMPGYGELPVPVGDWTPAMITALAPNAIDLNEYDVYWGAGE